MEFSHLKLRLGDEDGGGFNGGVEGGDREEKRGVYMEKKRRYERPFFLIK